jgi:hypothetical protein
MGVKPSLRRDLKLKEEHHMKTPGFAAEASLYGSSRQYYTAARAQGILRQSRITRQTSAVVPQRWAPCQGLSGCAYLQCLCAANGGIWVPHASPHSPCGRCVYA